MDVTQLKLQDIPKLGFGFMRLPQKNGEIDLDSLSAMVDAYMENGFVYFDTAYVYHNGESETALRKTLVERYPRDQFFIADKLPAWVLNGKEDVEKVFKEQLARTGTEYFDFYLLHCVDKNNLKKYNEYRCFEWAMKKKEQGLIRRFGFSFHDSPELLDEVLTAHPEVEFVQLQINYADWESPQVKSRLCYETARKHGKPVIIMEPVKGGTLAVLPPEPEKILKAFHPDQSIASWAMRFCGSLDGVVMILSGMSSPAQMEDNLHTMKDFHPLSQEEAACIEEAKHILFSAPTVACTSCRYCVDGCPEQIKIPDIFGLYNRLVTYGESSRAKESYQNFMKENSRPDACIACGQCESVCPQHLPIVDTLKKASSVFE